MRKPKNRRPLRHAVSKEEDEVIVYINRAQSIYIVIGVKIIKLVIVNPSITRYTACNLCMWMCSFIRVYNRSIRS